MTAGRGDVPFLSGMLVVALALFAVAFAMVRAFDDAPVIELDGSSSPSVAPVGVPAGGADPAELEEEADGADDNGASGSDAVAAHVMLAVGLWIGSAWRPRFSSGR